MKKVKFIPIVIILAIMCFSCTKSPKKNDNEKKIVNKSSIKNKSNLNISFLLDLSDRISPKKYPNEAMEFYKRDVAYIKSVSEAFDIHLRNKKVRQMNDKIQLFFDPAPLNENINIISNQLKYHVTKNNISLELLDKIRNTYTTKPQEIYNLAINDNKYIGSNIWKFFKTKVKDYCINEDYRNIIVIITDGYIYHKNTKIREENRTSYLIPQTIRKFNLDKNNWEKKIINQKYGFITANKNLENLEVLILGINPDNKSPYEQDVIYKYWENWLIEMGVKKFAIKNADLPSNLDKIIKDFILVN